MKTLKLKSYRPKRLRITDIRKAVAKECLLYKDSSKKRITEITKAYLTQLKKDGFYLHFKKNEATNARSVNFLIDKMTSMSYLGQYEKRPTTTNRTGKSVGKNVDSKVPPFKRRSAKKSSKKLHKQNAIRKHKGHSKGTCKQI